VWNVAYEKQFETILSRFCDFLKAQDKINTAEDLVPGLTYERIDKLDGTTTRAILWNGVLIDRSKYDAQMNVQLDFVSHIQSSIFIHLKDVPLYEGWVQQVEPYISREQSIKWLKEILE